LGLRRSPVLNQQVLVLGQPAGPELRITKEQKIKKGGIHPLFLTSDLSFCKYSLVSLRHAQFFACAKFHSNLSLADGFLGILFFKCHVLFIIILFYQKKSFNQKLSTNEKGVVSGTTPLFYWVFCINWI
jgi:hypothetical protein